MNGGALRLINGCALRIMNGCFAQQNNISPHPKGISTHPLDALAQAAKEGEDAVKWSVQGTNINGEKAVLCWGESKESLPDARERKVLRADGYKIIVDGKVYKD